MDFTFLFIVVLMLLASQSGNVIIAGFLFIALLVTSKDKYMFAAAFVGLGVVLVMNTQLENKTLYMLGGLFAVLLLIARDDLKHPQPAYGGGY